MTPPNKPSARPRSAVEVRGGRVVLADIFAPDFYPDAFDCGIADPPYGDAIVKAKWDKIDARTLAANLQRLAGRLATVASDGAHFWMWGGIGKPNERALYRALIAIEDDGRWQCAEQITWRKKRGYGTDWRCLMTREECLRFVLGNAKKPRVYNVQFTDELRGYAGFNPEHPAKNDHKRLTAIWDHASDMGQNKPHECHKPAPLARSQILATTNPGDRVIELFAGSGEACLVAREIERPFVAYEGDPDEFEKLVARLS